MAHGVPALHPEEKGRLNISPKVNAIEARGGLPPYLNAVAVALVRKGMARSRAIATAVNVMKKTCATGRWNGRQEVSPAIKGAACNAVRQWEQLKVATSVSSDARMSIELARRWEDEDSLEFAWRRLEARAILELAIPKPRRGGWLRQLVRAAIFGPPLELAPSTAERNRAAAKGQAMSGGRFPIRNHDDLKKAIHAVGRAKPSTSEHNKVRRFVIKRAKAIGGSHLIPSNWAADGSLQS